jgi:metal-responsive CopG/Arc/MetJ family transcriptional regulator
VKTAISIPDTTFERASHKAQALGMSRSEFFTRAATRYLDELDDDAVTDQINAAVDSLDEDENSSEDAVAVGRRVLVDEGENW